MAVRTTSAVVITKRGRPVAKPVPCLPPEARTLIGSVLAEKGDPFETGDVGCRLPQPFPGDPADQIIVATARDRDATLITMDRRLRAYPHLRSDW